jgi:hypothetical protein
MKQKIENKEIYIHIGYSKTATTTLQNNLFAHLKRFDIIGKPWTSKNNIHQKIIETITECETMEYNGKDLLNEVFAVSHNAKLLISHEGFSGGPILSGRVSRYEIACRLKNLFPQAKILIVLREQKSMIKSRYLEKLKNGRTKLNFNEWFKVNSENMHKENIFQYFHYDKILELYIELFGDKNVEVLLFEDFKVKQEYFLKKLFNWLSLPYNEREVFVQKIKISHDNKTVTQETLMLGKLLKRYPFIKNFIPRNARNFIRKSAGNGRRLNIKLSEDQEDFINNLYAKSNLALDEKFNLAVREYNYFLGVDRPLRK